MQDARIRNIVIVGGGTAGWMAASAMVRILGREAVTIRLVESEAIGIIGVGESTIPHIRYFNKLLDLPEDDFVRRTNATFKLGIEFVNWGRLGDNYIHPFGPYGVDMEGIHFHHFWLRQARSENPRSLEHYNLQILAARAQKFRRPDLKAENSPMRTITYAFQFDASLYAKYMREYAETRGVLRTEGKITEVRQHAETGHVTGVVLESGELIEGDLFIDCSGFRGLLIDQTLKTEFEDWSAYLPNNRAIACTSHRPKAPDPLTRAMAKKAGWQWRIPLQNRNGDGYVYCNEFISDDEALASLIADLDGEPITEPRLLRFKAGMRVKPWNKNVVSLGLASGFLEPLESTSIHLIQSSVARLLENFPDKHFNQLDIDYYNARTRFEFERVRDFLVLHYNATERDDSPFWDYCRNMQIPPSLAERIALFRENARLHRVDNELFNEVSWFAVLNGQNIEPKRYHPVADILSETEFQRRMTNFAEVTQKCVDVMPTQQQFIDQNCRAKSM